jgi:hypothetical protein
LQQGFWPTTIKNDDFLLAGGWVLGLWLGRDSRERSPALATLQIVEVEAQQTCRDMNVSAMRTRPRRLMDVVVAFARQSRDLVVQESVIADFQRKNLTLISVSEPDLLVDDSSRILMRQMLGAFFSMRRHCWLPNCVAHGSVRRPRMAAARAASPTAAVPVN